MNKVISILLFSNILSLYLAAQLPTEEIAKIKSKLRSASSDSAKFQVCMELSQGYRFSNVDSALQYTNKAIEISHAMNSPAAEADALSQKGFIVLETGDIPFSLQCQLEALRLSDKFSNPVIEAFTLNRIGNVYTEIGDYRTAIDYYRKSISLFAKVNQQGYIHNELSNIGNDYDMMGVLDSAKIYQQRVYNFSLTNTDRYAITYAEMRDRFGTIEAHLGNYNAALMHYRAGIGEALRDEDMNNLALIYLQLAKLFNKLQLYDSGFIYAKKTIATASSIFLKRAIYEAAGLLAGLYKLKNRPDSALAYSELSAAIKDSLYGRRKIQELQRILLSEQVRQQQLRQERDQLRQRYKVIALLTIVGVFLVVGIILFRNNRQKQRTNKILESTLSHLRSTQSQLIQSEKMASLGELTAGIAHEIQNPLNFVNNFSEVSSELIEELKSEKSKMKGERDEETENQLLNDIELNLQKISHHGKRADAIVKGMLQHSRSSTGEREATDINALADEYLRLAYHGLRAKDKSFNATTKTDFDGSIGKINVVPQDIGRVILNLINNSFYAVSEKKRMLDGTYEPVVQISTRRIDSPSGDGKKIEIKVSDNGNGIPQKVLDKIFQPFFTTKPTGTGTGLGLSLSYDIVTKGHGGNMRVENAEGNGATFIVEIPIT